MTTPTIGIACHSFRTDGGMGRYVQLLSEGLLNLGIRPTVITKKIDYSLPLSKEVSFHHINCKFIPSKLRDYYYDYKLGKFLQSTPLEEALQKPLFPSRIEQNRSVRFFFTTSKNGVFLPSK